MEMDCRPSDAIALALRCGAPILVANEVMEEAGRVIETPQEGKPAGEPAPAAPAEPQHGAPLSPLEALNRKLARAVEQERYEDAAKLRDEINKLKEQHTGN
jgi:bifunctional DNase/RNase